MAGWVAIVGSALMVLTLFDSMSQVRSIEMRESIEEFLASPPGSGLGLTVPGTVELIRGLMMFAGAVAAAATVLGIYVLQRNKGARLGFTVAAVAIILTAPVSGGFLPVLIAFAAVMLWTGPAREWFAGSGGARPQAATGPRDQKPDPASSQDSLEGTSGGRTGASRWTRASVVDASGEQQQPRPTEGFGTPPSGQDQSGQGYGQQPPVHAEPPQYGQPQPPAYRQPPVYGQPPQYGEPQQYGGYPRTDPDKRPSTVTIAAWLTWVMAGLTLLVYGIIVLVLLAARDELLAALRAEPQFQALDIASDDLIAVLWVVSAIFIVWCLSAIVLAVLAFRRVNWARIVLVVSASVAALFSFAAFPFSLFHLLASVAVVTLLFTGGANQWYSRRNGYIDQQQGGSHQWQPPGNAEEDQSRNVW